MRKKVQIAGDFAERVEGDNTLAVLGWGAGLHTHDEECRRNLRLQPHQTAWTGTQQ